VLRVTEIGEHMIDLLRIRIAPPNASTLGHRRRVDLVERLRGLPEKGPKFLVELFGMVARWRSAGQDSDQSPLQLSVSDVDPISLAETLLSLDGQASGIPVAKELIDVLSQVSADRRLAFWHDVTERLQPDVGRLTRAAQCYIEAPSADAALDLFHAAEPPRQELLRRLNMAPGGTAALVTVRKELLAQLPDHPDLRPLDDDLKHLFISWFNRGFLDIRRIDWETPAVILEKLIAYEAVHEIRGWDDLRRRLAPDRRCFAFFHPAMPSEPLIFVEVALVKGLVVSIQPLLTPDADTASQESHAMAADTAIFYSISNCQDGLRGIAFGNFLIKQVVEELRTEFPGLRQHSTLSPVPGFRRWLETCLRNEDLPDMPLDDEDRMTLCNAVEMPFEPERIVMALRCALANESWPSLSTVREALRPLLLRLCAFYLTRPASAGGRVDPVGRFHLGNGARLEQVNWMANSDKRGIKESYGIMVNYLYDFAEINANQKAFHDTGFVRHSAAVEALLNPNGGSQLVSPEPALS
jgi:malonyl-CoA decarboxylase